MKVPSAQGDHVVQTLAPEGSDEPLTKTVGEGTPARAFQHTQSEVSNGLIQIRGKDAIAVMNEVPIAMIGGDGFAKLL